MNSSDDPSVPLSMTSNVGPGNNSHGSDGKPRQQQAEDALPDDSGSGSPDAVVGKKEEEDDNEQRLEEIVRRERRDTGATQSSFHTAHGSAKDEAEAAQLNEEDTLPPSLQAETSGSEASSISGPDDTPSVHGSVRSSPSSSVPASRASSRLGHSPSPQPFERRFKARITSGSPAPRALTPAFLSSHSRQSSASSQLTLRSQEEEKQDIEARNPWEVIRWTKLRKISQQAFSESGKRAFGRPTVLCIGASIAVGTSKGIILLFDYQQVLKSIIGQGTPGKKQRTLRSRSSG